MAKASQTGVEIKDWVLIGAVGVVGYLIYKSKILQGAGTAVQGLGEGISTGAQGLGEGISTIGSEAGDIVGNVSALTDPLGAVGAGVSDVIGAQFSNLTSKTKQQQILDAKTFQKDVEPISDINAMKNINIANEQAKRSGLIQDQITDVTRAVTTFDERLASTAKKVSQGIQHEASVVSNFVKTKVSKEVSAIKAAPAIVAVGLKNVGYAINQLPKPTNVVKAVASTAVSKAKSLISSITSKLKKK